MQTTQQTFPCDYLVKIIATQSDDFPKEVIDIIEKETTLIKQVLTPSKNQKYLSLSVTLHLKNEEELETLYKQIKDKPYIKMIL